MSQRFGICERYAVNAKLFRMYEPFAVGGFLVKPYLMDHSAFDAAAFAISAEGKTVVYSGDFRGHGRKAICLDRFIRDASTQADALFTEGTTISRKDEKVLTEEGLEAAAVDRLRGQTGIALFQSSSQNIDRLVSFFRAALKLGRTFVVDVYTANVLHELRVLGGNNLPYPSYDNFKVFFPYGMTQKVFNEIGGEYAKRFSAYRISRKQVNERQNEILMLARPSMQRDLDSCDLTGGTFFYSLWQGYRESAHQQTFENWLAAKGICREFVHTSGHATPADIRRVIDGLAPKKIIPIHTMVPEAFLDYSDKIELQNDGVAFDI